MNNTSISAPLGNVQPQLGGASTQAEIWMRKREIAHHYCCNIRTITNLMRRRILPFVKIGNLIRFDVHACDEAMRKYQRRSIVL